MMKKGFTLIELLVVILIIGILSSVALPQYKRAVAKARATEALVALKAITDAQEVYYIAYDDYASDISQLDVKVEHGRNYTYSCANKNSCSATPADADCPVLEFHLSQKVNNANDNSLGKRWCLVSANSSEVAQSICKSFGPEDTTMPSGKYYLIGNIKK